MKPRAATFMQIDDARDLAQWKAIDIRHATHLLEILGEHIGESDTKRTAFEWAELGGRVEYLARVIRDHVEALDDALTEIEKTSQAGPAELKPVPIYQGRRAR